MAIKKSDLYSSLWASCDELRGGMDVSTVVAWLASVGVTSPRRAKKLKAPMREQLIVMLRGGADRAAVA